MDREVAKLIPALQIEVTDAAEDWFYILMCCKGKVSKEIGKKTLARINLYNKQECAEGLRIAEQMEKNLEEYGVACAEWAKNIPQTIPA